MKFRQLEVRTFNRVRAPFTIPLDEPGLILVQGVNRDYGEAANSNAAGKSWIWEAFLWALYGKMARHGNKAVTAEAVHPTRGADVQVAVEVSGHEFQVVRTRATKGRSEFKILHPSGEFPLSRDPSQRVDDAAALFGFDYQACRAAIILQGEGMGLAKAEFAVQMSVLEAVLRMAELSEAAEHAKAYVQHWDLEAAKSLAQQSLRKETLDAERGALQALLNTAPDPALVKRLRKERDQLLALEATLPARQAANEGAREALAKVRQAVAVCAEKLSALEQKATELRRSVANAVCPTCLRPLKDEAELAALKQQQTDVQFDWHKAQLKKTEAQAKVEPAEAAWRTMEQAYQEAAAAKQAVLEVDAHLLTMEAAQDDYTVRVKTAEAKVVLAERALWEVLQALEAIRASRARADYWVKGFGRDGLQAQIFQSAVPVLNSAAERYAETLSDGKLTVTFNPTRGTRLDDLIRVGGASAPTYDGLSRGEKQRVNLIVAWSLRELARWRLPEPINLAVYDETFDGFDDAGLGVAVELLQEEVAQGMTVFVVTHNATMKRLFPGARVLTVTREQDEATVTWS